MGGRTGPDHQNPPIRVLDETISSGWERGCAARLRPLVPSRSQALLFSSARPGPLSASQRAPQPSNGRFLSSSLKGGERRKSWVRKARGVSLEGVGVLRSEVTCASFLVLFGKYQLASVVSSFFSFHSYAMAILPSSAT